MQGRVYGQGKGRGDSRRNERHAEGQAVFRGSRRKEVRPAERETARARLAGVAQEVHQKGRQVLRATQARRSQFRRGQEVHVRVYAGNILD